MANDEHFQIQIDQLGKQVASLKEVAESLDHRIRGNGQPGLLSDVRKLKDNIELQATEQKEMEKRILDAISHQAGQMADTGDITKISMEVARSIMSDYEQRQIIIRQAREERDLITRKFEEERLSREKEIAAKLDAERKEKEQGPGSFYEFRKWLVPALISLIFGVVSTLLVQYLLNR